MEFVTKRPTAEDSAMSDIMLMPKSAKYMNVNAPMTEIGIVRAAISVVESLPKKRSKSTEVSTMASAMFWITLSTDSWIASDLS